MARLRLNSLKGLEAAWGRAPSRSKERAFKKSALIVRAWEFDRAVRLSKSGGGEWPPLSKGTIENRRGFRKKRRTLMKRAARQHAAKFRAQARLKKIVDKKPPKSGGMKRAKFYASKAKKIVQLTQKLVTATKAANKSAKALQEFQRTNGGVAILWDTGILLGTMNPMRARPPGYIELIDPEGVELGYGGGAPHPKGHGLTIAELAAIHHYGTDTIPPRRLLADPSAKTVRRIEEVVAGEVMGSAKG